MLLFEDPLEKTVPDGRASVGAYFLTCIPATQTPDILVWLPPFDVMMSAASCRIPLLFLIFRVAD